MTRSVIEPITRGFHRPAGPQGPQDAEGIEQLLTAEEIAELFTVPVSWVYGATRGRAKRKLPHIKVGRYTRFEESAVRSFLDAHKKGYSKRNG